MFDDDDRIAAVDEHLQDVHQFMDVGRMEARRRFVEDVQRPAGAALGQFRRQFDTLGFAAGQGRRRLAQADIAQTDLLEGLHLIDDARLVFKEIAGVVDGHVEDVGNGLALVFDFQRFPIVAGAWQTSQGT